MNEVKESKKELIKYLGFIILAIVIIASVIIPLPYYVEVPGSAENVRNFVTVNDERDKNDGSYMMTTVGIKRGTVASLLTAKLMPFQEIISKEDLMGDSSDDEYDKLSAYQMTSSENMAKKVALDLSGKPYQFDYKGVYVMAVSEQSAFKGELMTGDVIEEVDSQTFNSTADFMTYIKSKKIGEEVRIDFKRDGESLKTFGKLTEGPDDQKAAIGITLVDHTELKTKDKIEINAGDIGGPSAGLMFTLETYQLLAGVDLRDGREIAGTGTINEDGSVGSIGGIDKKVVAADHMGATVFFAPAEEFPDELLKEYPDLETNYQEAQRAAKTIDTKMEIVPVKTVQDAIDYLNKTRES
ncbi:PDZ domain-containing protein [Vagococcus coleopterorum]|uniref:endopeptidase La n=1 Tax=Vagococcus coleopterorum TaxID=2714946 RepID=A0A6G8AMN4_9ENTE|nr:SepM family pheromone-processing serine protease [Vagococcus coleopterorum]QIL46341.1 PDZ domain-containing protein [Vagococcus coleopterorum]